MDSFSFHGFILFFSNAKSYELLISKNSIIKILLWRIGSTRKCAAWKQITNSSGLVEEFCLFLWRVEFGKRGLNDHETKK